MTTSSKLEKLSTTQLAELYNSLAEPSKRIKKFSDRATALRRTNALQEEHNKKEKTMLKKTNNIKEEQPKTTSSSAAMGRVKSVSPKKLRTIKILAGKNPRREGTHGHENFKLYEDGMTVQEYVAAGGASNHLNWDLKNNFISLSN